MSLLSHIDCPAHFGNIILYLTIAKIEHVFSCVTFWEPFVKPFVSVPQAFQRFLAFASLKPLSIETWLQDQVHVHIMLAILGQWIVAVQVFLSRMASKHGIQWAQ